MSETQLHDKRNAQQTDSEPEAPFEDDLWEQPRQIPSNVLSLDFSEHSDDELAKMYESTRKTSSIEEFEQIRQRSRQRRIAASFAEMYGSAQSTASVKELEQARQRSLRGHTDEEFARQRRRARGGPVRPEDANLVAATDDPIAPLSQTTT